jgi:hypothetical protein
MDQVRSTRRAVVPVLAWALAALAIGVVFAASMADRIAPQSDLWDYSQEARQIARGEGFTSLYTYPVHLRPGGEPPFPVRWRMPLYAVLGAGLLDVGVPLPAGYIYLGALTHALLVALVWLLAVRISRSPWAGHVAAACALLCPLLLDPYNPGMSQMLSAALGLGVWLLLLGPARAGPDAAAVGGPGAAPSAASPSAPRLAAAALLAAAAWYLRGESAIFVPLWLWTAGTWRRRAGFAAVYAVLCGAWLVALRAGTGDSAPIQGNPMLLYTKEYPGYTSSRSFDTVLPGVLEYVRTHPLPFALRFAKDVAGYVIDLAGGLGPLALALGIAALGMGGIAWSGGGHSFAGAGSAPSSLRRAALLPLALAIPWQILAFSSLERSPRFLVPVVPIACALIGAAAGPVLAARRRLLVALAAALLLERGATLAFQRADSYRREPPLPAALAAALEPAAVAWPRDALVLTDVPDWVAWRLDRPALLLPLYRDLGRVLAAQQVSAILVSPRAHARNLADGDSAWVDAIEHAGAIPGFEGPQRLPGGARLYSANGPAQDGPARVNP